MKKVYYKSVGPGSQYYIFYLFEDSTWVHIFSGTILNRNKRTKIKKAWKNKDISFIGRYRCSKELRDQIESLKKTRKYFSIKIK